MPRCLIEIGKLVYSVFMHDLCGIFVSMLNESKLNNATNL
jgi:hypothetical protein